jgi:hypothetical protein
VTREMRTRRGFPGAPGVDAMAVSSVAARTEAASVLRGTPGWVGAELFNKGLEAVECRVERIGRLRCAFLTGWTGKVRERDVCVG